jgi:putative solute:sodium symporter small subunit
MVMVSPVITKRERYIMSKNEQHWEKTRGLLFVTLAIWFVFSIGIFLFAAEMNEVTGPFGYPLTYWFTCQGSLGIFVILIFWFANRQEKIDEEFGFSEKGDD